MGCETRVALAAGLAVGALALGAGCMRDGNSRLTLGHEAEGNGIVMLQAVADVASIEDTGARSVYGLDRSGWAEREVLVPNDGVFTYPHLTRMEPLYEDGTARSRGEFPSALTALETEHDVCSQVAETFAWPGWVLTDLVLAIPRAMEGVQANPVEGYARSSDDRWFLVEPPVQDAAPMDLDDEAAGE